MNYSSIDDARQPSSRRTSPPATHAANTSARTHARPRARDARLRARDARETIPFARANADRPTGRVRRRRLSSPSCAPRVSSARMLPLLVAAACASALATRREAARDAREAREATEDVLALALDVNEGDVARAVEADARARERRERREGRASSTSASASTRGVEEGDGDEDEDGDEGREGRGDGAACRFCFEERGELVSPCACDGTGKYVHVRCLREWQRVSLASYGTEETSCRVCRAPFSLPKAPLRQRLRQWFSPRADDRVAQYTRVWLQMMLNTALPGEESETLTRPTQLVPLVSATELRIWAKREIRKGNRLLRSFALFGNACELAYSAFVIVYLSAGMTGIGIEVASTAALDAAAAPLALPMHGFARGLLNFCTGPLSALVRLTQPLHHLVHFFTMYPSYNLALGAPDADRDDRRGRRDDRRAAGAPPRRRRPRLEFSIHNHRTIF